MRDGRAYLKMSGGALWVTDGTRTGTRSVTQWLGASGTVLDPPAFIGNRAVFAAVGQRDMDLLRRDGDGRTEPVGFVGGLADFVAVGDRVTFWNFEPDPYAWALMVTDGTKDGTKRLAQRVVERSEVLPFGNKAMFGVRAMGSDALSLWVTDLSESGTRAVMDLPADRSMEVIPLTAWRDLAFFAVGYDSRIDDLGAKVWRTDGTREGTFPLSDVEFIRAIPGAGGVTLIRSMTTGDEWGWELWTSDGTAAGTRKGTSGSGRLVAAPLNLPGGPAIAYMGAAHELHVRDIATGSLTVYPLGGLGAGQAVYANGRIFFNGCRGKSGCELWAISLDGGGEAEPAYVRVDFEGIVATTTGRGAAFRISMDTNGPLHPRVTASTVDGTLKADKDYVPFSREIVFEQDRDVTLVVPFQSEASGTMSVVLTSPANAVIVQGIATAQTESAKRRVAGR